MIDETTGDVVRYDMNGMMGGYGLWPILGVLLAIFLIIAIIKMLQKR